MSLGDQNSYENTVSNPKNYKLCWASPESDVKCWYPITELEVFSIRQNNFVAGLGKLQLNISTEVASSV